MGTSIDTLAAGGDSPGLNAAIRSIGNAATRSHDMNVLGFLDTLICLRGGKEKGRPDRSSMARHGPLVGGRCR